MANLKSWIAMLICLCVSIGFMIGAAAAVLDGWNRSGWPVGEGRVTGHQAPTNAGRSNTTYYPTFEVQTTTGAKVSFRSIEPGSPEAYPVHQKFKVRYSESSGMALALEAGWPYWPVVRRLGMSVLFGGMALFCMLAILRQPIAKDT